jgi:hypothetical protein
VIFSFIFTDLFWGMLLILLGISILVKVLLGCNIPIVRIFLALLLIYGGTSLIIGTLPQYSEETILFQKADLKPQKLESTYTIALSSARLDFSSIRLKEPQKVKVTTILGNTKIKLNKSIPTELYINTAFANAKLPDDNKVSISGSYAFKMPADSTQKPLLKLEANVVLGNLEINAE